MVSGVGTSSRGQWQVTSNRTAPILVNLRYLTDSVWRVLPTRKGSCRWEARDASIVDGRLEPGRRRGWDVCGSGVPVCRVPDVIRASVGWGLLGESSDEDSSGSLVVRGLCPCLE